MALISQDSQCSEGAAGLARVKVMRLYLKRKEGGGLEGWLSG